MAEARLWRGLRIVLYVPVALAAGFAGYLGGAVLIAGLLAGREDVAFGLDSGAPGWLMALFGLAILAAAALFAWLGWLVASGRAGISTLVVVALFSLLGTLPWAAAVATGGFTPSLAISTTAPYLLGLTIWRLTQRGRQARKAGRGRERSA